MVPIPSKCDFCPSKLLHPAVFISLQKFYRLYDVWSWILKGIAKLVKESCLSLNLDFFELNCRSHTTFPELGDTVSLYFSLPWPLPAFHTMDMFHHKFIHSPFKLILFFT